jgi:hypothetical protein
MRLGEGTGLVLAFSLIEAGVKYILKWQLSKVLVFKTAPKPNDFPYSFPPFSSCETIVLNNLTELRFLARLSPSSKPYFYLHPYNLEFQNVR